jgi:hypothetical protein
MKRALQICGLALLISVCAVAFLLGCMQYHKNESLNPQVPADLVKITNNRNDPIKEIKDKESVEKLISFINSLPPKWEVPWYGPPVGKIYFNLHSEGKLTGNFYVGPNFFGRDASYGHDAYNFFSQSATKAQIDQLGKIVGLDLWTNVSEKP